MPQPQLKNSLLSFGFSPIFFIKWDSRKGGGGTEPHNIASRALTLQSNGFDYQYPYGPSLPAPTTTRNSQNAEPGEALSTETSTLKERVWLKSFPHYKK